MKTAFDISPINNELEALAIHLGINTDIDSEVSSIEVIDFSNGIHRFKYAQKVYVVAHVSYGLPTDLTIDFNSCLWSITTKHMIKVIGIRSPAAVKNGWEDIIGQIFEFTGNAYYGFNIKLDKEKDRDLYHFYFNYINR
ncbi:MAG: hypothetical protein V7749_01075 [Cocleimonas sp.]